MQLKNHLIKGFILFKIAVEKAKSKYCWLLTDDDLIIIMDLIDIILEKICIMI